MRDFDFPLDPDETMTIRRVFTPRHVPSKGKAVYACDYYESFFLVQNDWEFISHSTKDRSVSYLRSPGGIAADSFAFLAAIPTDEPILRLADALIRFATRPPGPGDPAYFDGMLGQYFARFEKFGSRVLSGRSPRDCPEVEEQHRRDRTPSLHVGLGFWGTTLYWFDGFENQPTWDRTEYFSALRPGVRHRTDLTPFDTEK